jgi:hypothetical protein
MVLANNAAMLSRKRESGIYDLATREKGLKERELVESQVTIILYLRASAEALILNREYSIQQRAPVRVLCLHD